MKKALSILALVVLFTACGTDYGKKLTFGKGELYYTDKVTEAEAKSLGKYLTDIEMFPADKEVSYQIDKDSSNTYVFKMVLSDKKYTEDAEYLDNTRTIAGFMSRDIFANKAVEFWLCDDTFEPLKKVAFVALPDSIIKQSQQEEGAPGSTMPSDNVTPGDTAKGTPA